MNALFIHSNVVKAEWIKLKRSGTLWLCAGAALFLPLLVTLVSLFVDAARNDTGNRWDSFVGGNFQSFAGFFYPLFLVLMMVRLVYLEHRSDTWKLLETQPVPRLALYLAKWEVAAFLSLLCLLGVLLFSLLGGYVLQLARPSYKLQEYTLSWSKTLSAMIRYWISGLAILSLQYFLGLWIRNFAAPMGIGLIAVIAGSVFKQFGVLPWWPYAFPAMTSMSYDGAFSGGWLIFHEKLSLLFTLFFLYLGYRLFVRRSVGAMFRPLPQLLILIGVVAGAIAVAAYINRPVVLPSYGRTVLAGSVESDKPVSTVLLLRLPAYDTVVVLPVKDGSFGGTISSPLPEGRYFLRAGMVRTELYMGDRDSLFVKITNKKGQPSMKITGTRVAENQYIRTMRDEESWMLTSMARSFTPDEYAKEILSEWEGGLRRIDRFKTPDNIKPSPGFLKLQRQRLALRLLHLVDNHYPRIFSVYHPNEKLQYPARLETLRKAVDFNDPALAASDDYKTYFSEAMTVRFGRNANAYLDYLQFLQAKVTNPRARDLVLFETIQNDLLRVRDTALKTALLQQSLGMLSDTGLKKQVYAKLRRGQGLLRNQQAPVFTAETLGAQSYDLGRFANRYVVIDVWASWCGPCKREAPFFEELAERYVSEELSFVSISVDEDRDDWMMEAGGGSSKVLQLWTRNPDDFSRSFNVSTIPRYILIGPRGTILNADMPPPSDPAFEAILQREIPSLSNRIL